MKLFGKKFKIEVNLKNEHIDLLCVRDQGIRNENLVRLIVKGRNDDILFARGQKCGQKQLEIKD